VALPRPPERGNMARELRDYQQQAVQQTLEAFDEHRSALVVMPTGSGKTFTAAHIVDKFLPHGRVMWLAHRAELIYQAAAALHDVTGAKVDVEMASETAKNGWLAAPIVCSSVQTQISGRKKRRMEYFDPSEFSLIVTDEAHHSCAASYRRTIEYYQQNPTLKSLGLTASPDRSDEQALGKLYESVGFEYGINDAINDGWLTPIVQQSVYVEGLDFSDIGEVAGELNQGQLGEVMEFERNLHGIVNPTMELAGDRKALVFCTTVAQAERSAEIFNRHKATSARVVTGGTPKEVRKQIFQEFHEGRFQYLTNVGVVTEGVDVPDIECVVMGRPTCSRPLCAQMIGRGLRPLTGLVDGDYTAEQRRALIAASSKPNCLVLDFVGNAGKHKLVHPADILGGDYSDEVVELAELNAERAGQPVDVATTLQQAEREIARRHRMAEEARLRQKLTAKVKYSTAKINPFAVLDVEPAREKAWHKGRLPTQRQLDALEKFGVDTAGLSFTHASQLLDRICKRIDAKLCSYKQAKKLRQFGYDTTDLTFKQAWAMLDQLAKNGWRRVG
jgi:superfamily II DNA or RNA helicase